MDSSHNATQESQDRLETEAKVEEETVPAEEQNGAARTKIIRTFERRKRRQVKKSEDEQVEAPKRKLKTDGDDKKPFEKRKLAKKSDEEKIGAPNRNPKPKTDGKPAQVTKIIKKSVSTVVKIASSDLPILSPIAPAKVTETNKVREAVEAAKEMRQRLSQKEDTAVTSSASMKALKVAQQLHTSTRSPHFRRPSPDLHISHSKTKEREALEGFHSMLETLTRAKESILKATRIAMECANKGFSKQVMDIIMKKLKNERGDKKRVDLLFLVDSMIQYHHHNHNHKGVGGASYSHIVEAYLPNFLTLVAHSSKENRRQCLKVLSLWLKRETMDASLLKTNMANLDAGLNSSERQYQRAIDDPVRDMDDMQVDEYGSNTSFQLPGLLARRVEEEEEEEEDYDVGRQVIVGNGSSVEQELGLQAMAMASGSGSGSGSVATTSASPDERHKVFLEDVDMELEMEDVSPSAQEQQQQQHHHHHHQQNLSHYQQEDGGDVDERRRMCNGNGKNSNSSSKQNIVIPLPPSPPPSPPPLPQSPPPSPPPPPPQYHPQQQQFR